MVDDAVAKAFRRQMQSWLLYAQDEQLPNLVEITNSTVVAKDLVGNTTKSDETEIPAVDTNPPAATFRTSTDLAMIAAEEDHNFTTVDAAKDEANRANISLSENETDTSTQSGIDGADVNYIETQRNLSERVPWWIINELAFRMSLINVL